MCFRKTILLLLMAASCAPQARIQKIATGEISMTFTVPKEEPLEETDDQAISVDSIRNSLLEGPVVMNAIRDHETGEMVATDVISASKVTARFRNVAERHGYVSISFDVSVPSAMCDSRWQLKICPRMYIQGDTLLLHPIFITGEKYREEQRRGYERYEAFLSGIIRDSSDLIWSRQLEIFIQRNAEKLFGVSEGEALEHYKRHLRIRLNDRRSSRSDEMFHKYVKDPILTDCVMLDTVLTDMSGDFIYRYVHTFQSRPRLKKVMVALAGSLYERGEPFLELPFPEDLTFYISSLSTLTDDRPRYAGMMSRDSLCSELDTVYMAGVQALKELDYKTAVTVLRPYDDYNAALAFITADYNHTALDVLSRQDDTDAKVCYLKSMVLSRLGQLDEALKYFRLAIAYDPYLEHRANLDPEMYQVVSLYKTNPLL